MTPRILTLCVGNICRSPMAQAMLQRALPDATVISAGLSAVVGSPADPLACDAVSRRGMDLSGHRAQQVTQLMCQHADLILVMEAKHKSALEGLYPVIRGKVFRIGHHKDFNVDDPCGLPQVIFEDAYMAIERGLQDWLPRIAKLR